MSDELLIDLFKCEKFDENKIPPEFSEELRKGIKKYHGHTGRKALEEFTTQILTYYLLEPKEKNFRREFLKLMGIENFPDFKFIAEKSYGRDRMDIYGESQSGKIELAIENKLGSEINIEQPKRYASYLLKENSEYQKHVIILAVYSGLIEEWNSDKVFDLKTHINQVFQDQMPKDIKCRYIYWHQIFHLLKYIENSGKRTQLNAMFKHRWDTKFSLQDEFCADIGSGYWRRQLVIAYNFFAEENNLKSIKIPDALGKNGKPNLGPVRIPASTGKMEFQGARLQGARNAKCQTLLQFHCNGKVFDLSDEIANSPNECIVAIAPLLRENAQRD